MNAYRNKTKIALAVLALAASAGASAVPMTVTGVSGNYIVWQKLTLGPSLTAAPNAGLAAIQAALNGGNAATPGSNVELSKFGGPITSLTGNINGKPITLWSLDEGDWRGGLDQQYIQGAANSVGVTSFDMTNALNAFYTPTANLGGRAPWQLVSDPNISYVDMGAGHGVNIGLAGFLDATPVLQAMFPSVVVPQGSQVSEVVRVDLDGLQKYLYGFSATPSGVCAGCTTPYPSYTGNYEVRIPEPESLALFGIGLLGLFLGRRRKI
ncbi:MAG: NF038130 family PEP-CTERM protein [Rhodobacteraceae bacterium]|mgnify:CR=1 FL=1|nr:NF038130 family PEP-CTERM protein [Paracoccaceae bacterium]